MPQLAFADFDNDGRIDVFRADGSRWPVSYSGFSSWRALNTSSIRLPDLGFGDSGGDGRSYVMTRFERIAD